MAAFVLLLATATLRAAGSWKAYMAYSDITEIEKAGSVMFVLASGSLYAYDQDDHSLQTFDKTNGLNDSGILHIGWSSAAGRLVVVYDNGNIDLVSTRYKVDNVPYLYLNTTFPDKTVNDIYVSGADAYLSTSFGIVKLDVAGQQISQTYNLRKNVAYTYIEGGNLYAGVPGDGLYAASLKANLLDPSSWVKKGAYVKRDKTPDEGLLAIAKTLRPGGPQKNDFGYLRFLYGRLYTCSEESETDNSVVQVLTGDNWQIYQSEDVSRQTGVRYSGFYSLDVNPADTSDVAVGARTGLYRFKSGRFSQYYGYKNSPIGLFSNINNPDYQMVSSLNFDKGGTLWMTVSGTLKTPILELSPDGKWTEHPQPQLMKFSNSDASNMSFEHMFRMITDSRGLLWFANASIHNPALLCYNPTNNALRVYDSFINQDGTKVEVTVVRCVAEDKEQNIWAGTNMGPLLLTAQDIADSTMVFTQWKVPRNDGTNLADYLLYNNEISDITVDGAGRKWFATYNNGAFLISQDNNTQIAHFTADTTPLLSDDVRDIAINPATGEVFFATSKGLCSYMGDATAPADEMKKETVYAYPNPVRPGYTGVIRIVGLAYNADVKITTSSGQLVAQGRSNGGMFIWDGNDLDGRPVASGVYMAAVATENGDAGTVCKIAIVR